MIVTPPRLCYSVITFDPDDITLHERDDDMVRTQIQLTPMQMQRLREISTQEHISMAEVIRRVLDNWLTSTGSFSQDEQWQRSLAFAGKYASDAADVSKHHDAYLEEIYGS